MGLGQIESYEIAADTFNTLWNVKVCDYNYDYERSDFEMLLVNVATTRAATIEAEIAPISTLVRRRNEQIEELDLAQAELTGLQKEFEDGDNEGKKLPVSDKTAELVNQVAGKQIISKTDGQYTANAAEVASGCEYIKSRVDKLNNDSQSDMTRLQSLVDKRDESFETASSLSENVSGSRDTAIANMM